MRETGVYLDRGCNMKGKLIKIPFAAAEKSFPLAKGASPL